MVIHIHIIEIYEKQPQCSFALQFSHSQNPSVKFKKKKMPTCLYAEYVHGF